MIFGLAIGAVGLLILPSENSPLEFEFAAAGEFGMSLDEVDTYNDMVPGLNAKSRETTAELSELPEGTTQDEMNLRSKALWENALTEMDADDFERSALRQVIESSLETAVN